ALVEVRRDVEYGRAFDRRRDVVGQLAVRRFDFDHVRPQLSQELGRPGADRSDAQVKDADAVENAGHGTSFLRGEQAFAHAPDANIASFPRRQGRTEGDGVSTRSAAERKYGRSLSRLYGVAFFSRRPGWR